MMSDETTDAVAKNQLVVTFKYIRDVVALLFYSESFGEHCGRFSENKLNSTCSYCPTLDLLRTELSVIYLTPTTPSKMFNKRASRRYTKEAKKLLEIEVSNNSQDNISNRTALFNGKRTQNFSQEFSDRRSTLSILSVLSTEKSLYTTNLPKVKSSLKYCKAPQFFCRGLSLSQKYFFLTNKKLLTSFHLKNIHYAKISVKKLAVVLPSIHVPF
nr:unnamed protein product [Callosobruchus analis]